MMVDNMHEYILGYFIDVNFMQYFFGRSFSHPVTVSLSDFYCIVMLVYHHHQH